MVHHLEGRQGSRGGKGLALDSERDGKSGMSTF